MGSRVVYYEYKSHKELMKPIPMGLDRLESDLKWPRIVKGARMKRCERELLSSYWSKLGLFGKRNSIPTTLMLNTLSDSK
ncbi:hypothetical protein PIB30_043540 [Stylosanthes scabra]|uniref:Uncharacterized protein n=1 Tax=Stylosanthes scabra TaxID=79078 RepID=A0ABU6WDL6_9FABA|nr:hypothetical protein [Stylosanthes scabra]